MKTFTSLLIGLCASLIKADQVTNDTFTVLNTTTNVQNVTVSIPNVPNTTSTTTTTTEVPNTTTTSTTTSTENVISNANLYSVVVLNSMIFATFM
jgi:cytoskeletal protein RodZ